MDASINVSWNPFAFVGDSLPENEQWDLRCKAFIGIGAYFASKLPLIFTRLGVNNAPLGVIPDSVKYSFYFEGSHFSHCALDSNYI
jgi:maltose/moltooligosaccharide transporter